MKRLLFALVLLAIPAFAADAPKPIVLSATPEEVQALDQLIDAGVRAQGLAMAENGVYWHKKLVQAVADANKPAVPVAPSDTSAPAAIMH